MLIGRRIEKLERASPPTVARLIDRIEREAMNTLSRDQQRIVNRHSDDDEQSASELYQEALASAVKQVSDDDLNRMILFYEPTAVLPAIRQ